MVVECYNLLFANHGGSVFDAADEAYDAAHYPTGKMPTPPSSSDAVPPGDEEMLEFYHSMTRLPEESDVEASDTDTEDEASSVVLDKAKSACGR